MKRKAKRKTLKHKASPRKQDVPISIPSENVVAACRLLVSGLDDFKENLQKRLSFPKETVDSWCFNNSPAWFDYYKDSLGVDYANAHLEMMGQSHFQVGVEDSKKIIENMSGKVADLKSKMSGVGVAFKEPSESQKIKFILLHRAYFNDLACFAIYGERIVYLLSLARQDNNALLTILKIDKAIITMDWVQQRIRKAQMDGDWFFLTKLGKAIAKRPPKMRKENFALLLVIRMLWKDWFQHMRHEDIRKFLNDHKLCPWISDVCTVSKILNRFGLNKYQKVPS